MRTFSAFSSPVTQANKSAGGPRKLSDLNRTQNPLKKNNTVNPHSIGVWGVLKIPAGIFMPPCLQEIRLITFPEKQASGKSRGRWGGKPPQVHGARNQTVICFNSAF